MIALLMDFLRFVMWLEDTDKSSELQKVKINTLRTGLISDWQRSIKRGRRGK